MHVVKKLSYHEKKEECIGVISLIWRALVTQIYK